ncbi:Phosphoglycerate mutase family protein [Schleiferilactobacillus perolens DSM 12744]|uniref:Phosphoglycerate mutase family protein n=2 Tax=Schleiferilactobacillus perolens TaxID=100468 RepID=A0A0R1MRP2_9LACO|nr:Phosphoglycerate mutase family protein [Schleiferilactobacillus perolens DSM 12744]
MIEIMGFLAPFFMKTVNVYMIRHGQTFFNRYNRMQGWSDSPLTPEGIAGAHKVGERLAHMTFTHAYSSDTTRASNTMQIILSHNMNTTVPYKMTPLFREQFYGYFEGADSAQTWYMIGAPHGQKNLHTLLEHYTLDQTKDFMHATDPFHDAEDAVTYWTRLMKGFKMLREENRNGDNVLLVSHGTTIRSIADKFGKGQFPIEEGPKNASITKLQLTDSGINIIYYNNTEGLLQ